MQDHSLSGNDAAFSRSKARNSFGLMLALGSGGVVLLGGTFVLTILKENPMFWRNAGGYSVGLRQFTLDFYYPLLCLNFVFCAVVTRLALTRFFVGGTRSIFPIGVAIFLWTVLLVDLGVLCADNFGNVVEGSPLHSQGR